MIEPEGCDCAYVVRDFDAESNRLQGKKGQDSFLIALYSSGAGVGKLIRFKRKGNYWETFQYKQSDLTDFLGLPWDFVRENAMLDHANAKPEDYMKNYWSSFIMTLKNKELNAKLEEMIELQA